MSPNDRRIRSMNESREYVRYDSLNLVSYTLFNTDDEIIDQGVGRTLNISSGGILLEIEDFVEDEIKNIRMEIALDDNIVTVDGRVAFTLLTTECYTECGIKFLETPHDVLKVIQDYIDNTLDKTKKKPGLLREKDARIDSLMLTLSNEHKIIDDYVDSYRNLVEKPENELTIQNISKLLTFLKKDTSDHFYFEEQAVFKAAIYDKIIDKQASDIVNKFKNEHIIMMKELNDIIAYIQLLSEDSKTPDEFIIRKIYLLMGQAKKHSREEMELLVPLIEQNWEKMRYLNSLLI